MSHWEWEHGEIKLPSAETPRVKAVVREAYNAHRDRVGQIAKQWWQVKKKPRSTERYMELVNDFEPRTFGLAFDRYSDPDPIADQVVYVLQHIVYNGGTPRQVQQKDLDSVIGPKATNKTTTFELPEQVSITFKGNVLIWNVPSNNRAVEDAHAHPVAVKLFAYLRRMDWTRGSGGKLVGNNEYNGDSYGEGAGGNYVTEEFGPNVPKPVHYAGLRRF